MALAKLGPLATSRCSETHFCHWSSGSFRSINWTRQWVGFLFHLCTYSLHNEAQCVDFYFLRVLLNYHEGEFTWFIWTYMFKTELNLKRMVASDKGFLWDKLPSCIPGLFVIGSLGGMQFIENVTAPTPNLLGKKIIVLQDSKYHRNKYDSSRRKLYTNHGIIFLEHISFLK